MRKQSESESEVMNRAKDLALTRAALTLRDKITEWIKSSVNQNKFALLLIVGSRQIAMGSIS